MTFPQQRFAANTNVRQSDVLPLIALKTTVELALMLVAELERLNSRCTQQLMYPTVNVPNLTFSLFIQQQSILDVLDMICITYTVRCQNVESVTRAPRTQELHHCILLTMAEVKQG